MRRKPINIGDYIEFKFPEFLFDEEKLINYTVLNINDIPFDPKKIEYNKIVKVNYNNIDYLIKNVMFFCKPEKNELIKYLENKDDFEMIIKINNGYNYSNLYTKQYLFNRALNYF